MILYIDTTGYDIAIFAISKAGKINQKTFRIGPHESHKTLEKLNEFFAKLTINNPQSEIKKIICNKGPGSYTGTRVGVTITQALGLAWKIPVKFLSKEQFNKE